MAVVLDVVVEVMLDPSHKLVVHVVRQVPEAVLEGDVEKRLDLVRYADNMVRVAEQCRRHITDGAL